MPYKDPAKQQSYLRAHSKQWQIDHDHQTGKIRGLLCNECNKGLGNFQDKVALLRMAIEYLIDHEE